MSTTTQQKKPTKAQVRAANNSDVAQVDLGTFAPDLKKTINEGGAELLYVALDRVKNDPAKPRDIKPGVVQERAESMKLVGQRDPIELRPDGEDFIITEGHHRVAAARLLKWDKILALVTKQDAAGVAVGSAVMNMARTEQNAYEDGVALARLQAEKPGITHETLGKVVGRSPQWVADRLRMHALGSDIGPYAAENIDRDHEFSILEAFVEARGVMDEALAAQVRDTTRQAVVDAMKRVGDRGFYTVRNQIYDRLQKKGWRAGLDYPLSYDETARRELTKAPAVMRNKSDALLYYFPPDKVKELQARVAEKKSSTQKAAKNGSSSAKAELAAATARAKERREQEIHKRAGDRELIVAAKGAAKANEDLEYQLLLRVLCHDARYDDNQADRIAHATGLPYSGVKLWGKNGGQVGGYGDSTVKEKARLEYIRGLKPDQRRSFIACVASVHTLRDEPDDILKLVARTSSKEIEAAVRKEVQAEDKAFEKGAKPKKWWEDERRAACPVCKADKKQKCCSSPGGHTIATYHAERVAAAAKVPIVEPAPKKAKKTAAKPKRVAQTTEDDLENQIDLDAGE